jgi:hypothetical protein
MTPNDKMIRDLKEEFTIMTYVSSQYVPYTRTRTYTPSLLLVMLQSEYLTRPVITFCCLELYKVHI